MTITTTFEVTGAKTPLADEHAYVDALLAAHPNLTKHVLGQSVQGRELYALAIGNTEGQPSLVTDSLIHGNEWAAREASLIFAREVAASTDAAVADFLTRHPLWIVPTFNPDGFEVAQRNNANNINLNREGMLVSQPEGVAVVNLLRQVRPMGYINHHDNTNRDYTDMQLIGGATFETTDTLHALSEALIGNVMMPAARETNIWPTGATWYYAGNGNVQYFSQYGGAIGALSCTTEIGNDAREGFPAPRPPAAVAGTVTMLWAWLRWFVDNETLAVSTYWQQQNRLAHKVASGNTRWRHDGSRPIPGVHGTLEPRDRIGVGLTMPAAEFAKVADWVDIQGIIVDPQPDGTYYVPLGQPRVKLALAALDRIRGMFGVQSTYVTEPPARYSQPTDLWDVVV